MLLDKSRREVMPAFPAIPHSCVSAVATHVPATHEHRAVTQAHANRTHTHEHTRTFFLLPCFPRTFPGVTPTPPTTGERTVVAAERDGQYHLTA